jgi:hypothetical protein
MDCVDSGLVCSITNGIQSSSRLFDHTWVTIEDHILWAWQTLQPHLQWLGGLATTALGALRWYEKRTAVVWKRMLALLEQERRNIQIPLHTFRFVCATSLSPSISASTLRVPLSF